MNLETVLTNAIIETFDKINSASNEIPHKEILNSFFDGKSNKKMVTKKYDETLPEKLPTQIQNKFIDSVLSLLDPHQEELFRHFYEIQRIVPLPLNETMLPGKLKGNIFVLNVLVECYPFLTYELMCRRSNSTPRYLGILSDVFNKLEPKKNLVKLDDLFNDHHFSTYKNKLMILKLFLMNETRYKFVYLNGDLFVCEGYYPIIEFVFRSFNRKFKFREFLERVKVIMPFNEPENAYSTLMHELFLHEGVFMSDKDEYGNQIPFDYDVKEILDFLLNKLKQSKTGYDGGEFTKEVQEVFEKLNIYSIRSILKETGCIEFIKNIIRYKKKS